MYKQLISFLFFGLSLVTGFSIPRYAFIGMDSNDGLSNNWVLCMHQDRSGFIWLGTMGGLNRYDGYGFRTIKTASSNHDGLYNQRITDITEDNHGNLWLQSFGGMFHRYNMASETIHHFPDDLGYDLMGVQNQMTILSDGSCVMAFMGLGVFITDTNNITTIHLFSEKILQRSANIHFVYAPDPQTIYLGTGTGLLLLDRENPSNDESGFKFLHQPDNRNAAFIGYCENDTTVFFITANDGLFLLHKHTGVLTQQIRINGIDLQGLSLIQIDQHGRIWLGSTKHGLIGITENNRTIYVSSHNGSPINFIRNLKVDSDGLVWFYADRKQELYQYNPENGQVKYYTIDLAHSILRYSRQVIQYIFEDRNQNLWVGTIADGLLCYDRKQDKFITFKNDPGNPRSISSNGQLSIFEDKSGVLWIGTRKGGVNKINLGIKEFHSIIPNPNPVDRFHNEIGAMFADTALWFSTYENKLYLHPSVAKIIQSEHPSLHPDLLTQNINKTWFFSFMRDSNGILWAGSKGDGLFSIHPGKGNNLADYHFVHYTYDPGNDASVNINEIYDIIEDQQGNIWLASYSGGLILVTEEEGKIQFHPYNRILNPQDPRKLTMGRCVLADSKGRIWYGGLGGIYRFDISDNKFHPLNKRFYDFKPGINSTISYNDIKTIFEDRSGTIWIGTYGGGLDKYNEELDQFINYSDKDGLPSDIIYGIIQDNQGYLWLSTENGLSRFDLLTNSFINFFMNDGLLSNTFSEAKPIKTGNGELFFGTPNGIIFFKPWNIKQDSFIPEVLLSHIEISNKNNTTLCESSGIKNINFLDKLTLSHRQNNFSIAYASTSFYFPEKNKFAYMLENYDDDYNYVGNQHIATYTNLRPGEYSLKIMATNNDGIWNTNPRILTIIITPPVWKTKTAYVLYGCILLLFMYLSYKIVRKINRLKNLLKVEQEVSKIKLRFFTNISHEFRNPLTLIINPLSELLEDIHLDGYSQKLIALANRNAKQLLHLINEILDLRKIQNKMMELKITENDVHCFFMAIVENFEYLAQKRNIDYSFSTQLQARTAWFDTEKVEKIMTNLITNAFKFTQPGGKVSVALEVNNKEMTITVSDTGIGIDIQKSPKLFTRFYQQSEHIDTLHQGTGIGLSLIKELTELHNGTIKVDSWPEKGSRFQVILPVDPSSFNEGFIVEKRKWVVGTHASLINEKPVETLGKVSGTKPFVKLLIVEDEPELLEYLKEKLSVNYLVETAVNGLDGYSKAQCMQPDMIITDVMMPHMGGIEMTRKLRNSFETSHIPIIMLTGKTGLNEKIEGFTTGADAYVEKPFDYTYLVIRIESLINQRKLLRERYKNNVELELNSIGKNNRDQEFLMKVEQYIAANIESSELSVEHLYSNLGYSKTLFFNKLKTLTGYSPNNFIKIFRLRKAALLLKQNQYSVSEVANMVGYNDIDYFRKQFKSFFNTTPTEYAKMQ